MATFPRNPDGQWSPEGKGCKSPKVKSSVSSGNIQEFGMEDDGAGVVLKVRQRRTGQDP